MARTEGCRMPGEEDKSPQEQIKEGMWRIATQTVVILFAIAFGVLFGYMLWGDAPELKIQVDGYEKQVQELKNEREGQNARQAMCERDKADFKKRLDKVFDKHSACQKELNELKQQAGQ
jgi:predicted negative regulator of RcsB-dependent stress response